MATKTLPAGSLKLIIPDLEAAARNRGRRQAGGSRLVPMYSVLVLDDTGAVSASYSANLEPCEATLRMEPHSLQKQRPGVTSALRGIADGPVYFWAETSAALAIELP